MVERPPPHHALLKPDLPRSKRAAVDTTIIKFEKTFLIRVLEH